MRVGIFGLGHRWHEVQKLLVKRCRVFDVGREKLIPQEESMATNIPPHNLGEVIDGTIAVIDNPEISVEELIEIIPGPDFPTGGLILGRQGSRSAIHKGRGSVVMRGRAHGAVYAMGGPVEASFR